MKKILNYFKAYMFFSNLLFCLPVLVTIYLKRDIATTDILLLEASYYLTIFLFELPTGYIGDKIGHDKLVIIGIIGTAISYFIFAMSFNVGLMVLSQILLGIFSSCVSGSDLGSIGDYLNYKGYKDGLEQQKDIFAIATAGTFISYILSGLIIKLDATGILIFVLTGSGYVIALIFYILFKRAKDQEMVDVSIEEVVQTEQTISRGVVHGLVKNLKLDIIVCGILAGIVSASYLVSQIYYNEIGIQEEVLGLIYCASSISVILLTKSKLKFNKVILFIMPCMFLVTIVRMKLFVIVFILLTSLIKAKVYPFINNYIITYSENDKAFNMSINSLVNNVINAVLMVSLSKVVLNVGFSNAMIVLSVFTAILNIYLYSRHIKKYNMIVQED